MNQLGCTLQINVDVAAASVRSRPVAAVTRHAKALGCVVGHPALVGRPGVVNLPIHVAEDKFSLLMAELRPLLVAGKVISVLVLNQTLRHIPPSADYSVSPRARQQ